MELPVTFKDFLVFLGSPVFLGIVISILLVKWAWFNSLGDKSKFWIVGAICLVLPIASRALTLYLPESAVIFIEDWWPTIVGGFGIWTTTQIWNKLFGKNGAISKASIATLTTASKK